MPRDFFHSHVESKEQTERTRETGTDSWMESRVTAGGGEVRGEETEQKGERTHGRGQQCGHCWGEGYKGTKWSWEKYNKG